MKKLKATAAALCLILVLLVFNVPDINYGQGPTQDYAPEYEAAYPSIAPDSGDDDDSQEVCDSDDGYTVE